MGSRHTREVCNKVFNWISQIDPVQIHLSDYSQDYLARYRRDPAFFSGAYSQLLDKALRKLVKPASEYTFFDYGGGCGILSMVAKEAGFGTVVYIDHFSVAMADARKIAEKLNVKTDKYLCGDSEELVRESASIKTGPVIVCSFDVVEHIYDLEGWITSLARMKRTPVLLHTSANPCNPLVRKRLKKIHVTAELKGCKNNIRIDDRFLDRSFLEERKIIITEAFPGLRQEEISLLALKTRGLRIDDIKKAVAGYLGSGNIDYEPSHPTNTCEPYTGNWAERLISLKKLKRYVRTQGLQIVITGAYYNYSERKNLNIIKYLLNLVIRISDLHLIFLSPAITIEIEKDH